MKEVGTHETDREKLQNSIMGNVGFLELNRLKVRKSRLLPHRYLTFFVKSVSHKSDNLVEVQYYISGVLLKSWAHKWMTNPACK